MHEPAVNQTPPKPILVTVKHTSIMLSRGVQAVYDLMARKKLRAVKSDGRTLIFYDSIIEYVESLNAPDVRPPRSNRRYLSMR
jgi:hypothetical protein